LSIFGMTKKKAIATLQKAYQSGDFTKAISAYEEMIKKTPEDAEIHNDLGTMYLETKQLKESENCFRKAFDLSENGVSLNNLGRVYLAKGEHTKAMEYFRKAHELDPTDAQPWYNISICYRESGKMEDAFNELNKFLDAFPDHANGHSDLGIFLYDKGDIEGALTHYERSIQLAPNNIIGRVNIIKPLCDLKRFPDSKPHLEVIASTGINVRVDASDGKMKIFFNDNLFHECEYEN
jgi:tetratricopeptide (TPR) repeat protein